MHACVKSRPGTAVSDAAAAAAVPGQVGADVPGAGEKSGGE